MRTLWGTATDRGRLRALNEDSLLAYPPIFLVADGMGGHEAGDVASKLVIDEFSALVGRESVTADEIHEYFGRTAQRIRETLVGKTGGTTVAGAAITEHDGGKYWLVFNIGDSRVYRFADGELEQISVDHSVVQELVDRGDIDSECARVHPERHVVTRAVGTGVSPEPDYWMLPAGQHDRLLICSDGLTTELTDAQVQDALATLADPQQAADWLVEAAVKAGGRDNVTIIVVDVAAAWNDLGTLDETVERSSLVNKPDHPKRGPDGAEWNDELHGVTKPNQKGAGAR